MTTTLYLIRHAQSQLRKGVPNVEWHLSAQGHRQSGELSGLLSGLGIQRLFSSPYRRCQQTVAPFAEHAKLPCTMVPALREQTLSQELRSDFAEVWQRSWQDFDFALPGCETSRHAQQRFVAGVMEIAGSHEGETIAVCTHGNVIGLFLNHVDTRFGLPETERLRNPDILKFTLHSEEIRWHLEFQVPGFEQFATPYSETPVDGL